MLLYPDDSELTPVKLVAHGSPCTPQNGGPQRRPHLQGNVLHGAEHGFQADFIPIMQIVSARDCRPQREDHVVRPQDAGLECNVNR